MTHTANISNTKIKVQAVYSHMNSMINKTPVLGLAWLTTDVLFIKTAHFLFFI